MVAAGGFDDAREFWDKRFASEDYVFGTAPNVFLASQNQWFKPGVRVLDLACGEGRNAVWLAQQGCEVVAIDISPVAIEKARRLAAERGVHVAFELVDVRDWRWPPNAFDAVVSIFIQFAAPAERAQLFAGFVTTLQTQRGAGPAGIYAEATAIQDRRSSAGRTHVHGRNAARSCCRAGDRAYSGA